jgi:NAD(P)-dependent dehydrogenase (short-subunit alcohol dehydrogenase family)
MISAFADRTTGPLRSNSSRTPRVGNRRPPPRTSLGRKLKEEGKVAVISGGTSGIGLAMAERFVKECAQVFIFGRRQRALAMAVGLIGAKVTAIRADASRLEDLDRVADAVRSATGKVDVVVSSAGLVEQVPQREITPDHYDRTFALNPRRPCS